MDNIVAKSASPALSRYARPISPRNKLSTKAFYNSLRNPGPASGTVVSGTSRISNPITDAPQKTASMLGLVTLGQSATPGRQTSADVAVKQRPDQMSNGSPLGLNRLRGKSANGLRERRSPASPQLHSSFQGFADATEDDRQSTHMPSHGRLKLSVTSNGKDTARHILAEIDTSNDMVVTLRGDKAAVKGLEVFLVCMAEGDHTVWELRVKRNIPAGTSERYSKTSSGNAVTSPLSSPRTSVKATTPFTAVYTPPCEELDMYRADYFSTPVPRASLLVQSGATVVPINAAPCVTAATKPARAETCLSSVSPLQLSSKVLSTASSRRCTPSAYQALSCPTTPKRTRFSSGAHTAGEHEDSESTDDREVSSAGKGFSSLYMNLADAYRSAHRETEDESEWQRDVLTSTPADYRDGQRDPQMSKPASASMPCSPTAVIASRYRSPEHRYALHLPSPALSSPTASLSGAAGLITPRDITLDAVTTADSYPSLHAFASPKTPSCALRSKIPRHDHIFSSPGPFPTTPSLHSCSPEVSPGTSLFQRRLGEARAMGLKLGVSSQSPHVREILRPLRIDDGVGYGAPEAALGRLNESRGSIGSISLKGRQGWSETEPEGASDDDAGDGEGAIIGQGSKVSCRSAHNVAAD